MPSSADTLPQLILSISRVPDTELRINSGKQRVARAKFDYYLAAQPDPKSVKQGIVGTQGPPQKITLEGG